MISETLTLIRMDLLKLRRRRGLMAMALLIAVGSVSLIFTVNAIRHGANPLHVGPAGGMKNFENATDFLGMLAVVIAAMIGVTAGAGDAELGVLRDSLATGRSRVTVRLARRRRGHRDARDHGRGVGRGHRVLDRARRISSGPVAVGDRATRRSGAGLLGLERDRVHRHRDVRALTRAGDGERDRVRSVDLPAAAAVSFLGNIRDLLPLASFQRMAGDAMAGLSYSLAVAIAVAVGWALAAAVAGCWWARRVEA